MGFLFTTLRDLTHYQEESIKPIEHHKGEVETELLKQTLSILTNTSVSSTHAISDMKPAKVPSQNSGYDCENISTFLSNPVFRKLYNKSLDTVKKYKNIEANNWFLSQ